MGVYHISEDEALQKARSFIGRSTHRDSQVENLRYMADRQKALNKMQPWPDRNEKSGHEENESHSISMAYSLARKSVLHTLLGAKDVGWRDVQKGLVHAGQAPQGNHCLQRLYGVGIWNRLEADDPDRASKLIADSEKLIALSKPCAACTLELYPWFSYYFSQTGQLEKVRECVEAVSEFDERTGNPTFKVIVAMIKSSFCILEKNQLQADRYSQKSFRLLEEAVPRTARAGIEHFLNRMLEQQAELVRE